MRLKYERVEPLGRWFAKRVAQVVRKEQDRLAADLVVPVPLHYQRARKRGFNPGAIASPAVPACAPRPIAAPSRERSASRR